MFKIDNMDERVKEAQKLLFPESEDGKKRLKEEWDEAQRIWDEIERERKLAPPHHIRYG